MSAEHEGQYEEQEHHGAVGSLVKEPGYGEQNRDRRYHEEARQEAQSWKVLALGKDVSGRPVLLPEPGSSGELPVLWISSPLASR